MEHGLRQCRELLMLFSSLHTQLARRSKEVAVTSLHYVLIMIQS